MYFMQAKPLFFKAKVNVRFVLLSLNINFVKKIFKIIFIKFAKGLLK